MPFTPKQKGQVIKKVIQLFAWLIVLTYIVGTRVGSYVIKVGNENWQIDQVKDFTGSYFLGNGYENWQLDIEPDARFRFIDGSEFANHSPIFGTIIVSGNSFKFRTFDGQILTRTNQWICYRYKINCKKSHILIPIKWGDRKDLVFAEDLAYWCTYEIDQPSMYLANNYFYNLGTLFDTLPMAYGSPILLDGSDACEKVDVSMVSTPKIPTFPTREPVPSPISEPEIADIRTLVIDPAAPATLYAGTRIKGVFKSSNGGETWHAINAGLSNTTVQILAIDPLTPTTLYAGTWGGGVFKSSNGGETWSAINTGLSDAMFIDNLIIASQTPSTLYLSAGSGGVFKSTNGGEIWSAAQTRTTQPSSNILTLVNDPVTDTILYAGTQSDGIFKSTNGGEDWSTMKMKYRGLGDLRVQTLAIDPQTPTTLYAGTAADGAFKNTDSGESWYTINTGMPIHFNIRTLAIDPITPTTLYAGTNAGIFKSLDGGKHWNAINAGLTSSSVKILVIDPQVPTILYAGIYSGGVFKSTDGGQKWRAVNTGLIDTGPVLP